MSPVANVAATPENPKETAAMRLAELVYEESRKYVPGRESWAALTMEAQEYYAGLVDHGFFIAAETLPRGTNDDGNNKSASSLACPSAGLHECFEKLALLESPHLVDYFDWETIRKESAPFLRKPVRFV